MGGKPRERSNFEMARASRELTMRILQAAPGGIVHVDSTGAIQAANEEALRILGMSFDALTQQYVVDFETDTIWEDGSPCSVEDYPVTRALMTGEAQPRATIGVRRPDGEVSWAVFTAVPVHDAKGQATGAVVTFLDITERRALEDLKARLFVSERLASLGTLAAGVAHEINNPLTYVLLKLTTLVGALEKNESRAQEVEDLRTAIQGAERIASIVRDLGTFSRSSGDSSHAVILSDVIELAVGMAATETRYRAQVIVDAEEGLLVKGDEVRIGQVLLNLIVNAAQSIEAGDIHGNQIRIRARRTGASVSLEVEDTGLGMNAQTLERIFEPFMTTKGPDQGTGLGLHICYQIVKSLGGSIRAESRPTQGTRFVVELPAGSVSAPKKVETPATRPDSNGAVLKILVVDDEPEILEFYARHFSGHETRLASNGREALTLLDEGEFDLIFCDLIMPDVTGMDVYEHVFKSSRQLAESIVFMTGGTFTERSRRFVDKVSNKVLLKPFPLRAVDDCVDAARAALVASSRRP